ncbi:MAG: hypothetical protein LBU32_31810 [Clostridiales bacterium]|jgi:hypothetical protein|nr:hypothetical protein [Clostridiales bacterium]
MARKLKFAINQTSSSIIYPGTSTAAFADTDFFHSRCTKSISVKTTVSESGSAVCSLAAFILSKAGLPSTNANILTAVTEASKKGTNISAQFTGSSFSVQIGAKKVDVTVESSADIAQTALDGDWGLVELSGAGKPIYALIDGFDPDASGFDRYLAMDSGAGKLSTLKQIMESCKIPAVPGSIAKKYKLS